MACVEFVKDPVGQSWLCCLQGLGFTKCRVESVRFRVYILYRVHIELLNKVILVLYSVRIKSTFRLYGGYTGFMFVLKPYKPLNLKP